MTLSNAVQVFAGIMILVALLIGSLGYGTFSVLFLAFIGINLIQSAFTGFCPAAMVLKKLPFVKA
ncbi:YgaP family membrane protein [Thiothrix lacustris]|uniref:YgaP family membrane protein n=1 Tax=Thiothrix lacustris TaxID=525917 RepID=UPI0027E456AC|nr:DUF2892 domain-containing protein [Thiothrix lacustris]WMP19010.1 DUF2892 domain-containing protein [Thiothrix lacustris]